MSLTTFANDRLLQKAFAKRYNLELLRRDIGRNDSYDEVTEVGRITHLLQSIVKDIRNVLGQRPKGEITLHKPPAAYEKLASLTDNGDGSTIDSGVGLSCLSDVIGMVLENSVNTASPKFNMHHWADQNIVSVVGDMLTAILNTTTHTYNVAPLFTMCEREVLKQFCDLFDFGYGVFAPGGSSANQYGMFLAREHLQPTQDGKRHIVLTSAQSHYSVQKSCKFLRMDCVKVKVNSDDTMDMEDLKRILEECGDEVMMINCTHGTTVKGTFDDLSTIRELADEYGFWVHVDAAVGVAEYMLGNQLEKGKADSIAIDFHKLLGATQQCSALLVKDKDAISKFAVNATYIFKNEYLSTLGETDEIREEMEENEYDIGYYSFQCGRRIDSFKLWLQVKIHGLDGMRDRVRKLFDGAESLREAIRQHPKFTLLECEGSHVIWKFKDEAYCSDRLLHQIRHRLYTAGKWFFNYSVDEANGLYFRLVVVSPQFNASYSKDVLSSIIEMRDTILREQARD